MLVMTSYAKYYASTIYQNLITGAGIPEQVTFPLLSFLQVTPGKKAGANWIYS